MMPDKEIIENMRKHFAKNGDSEGLGFLNKYYGEYIDPKVRYLTKYVYHPFGADFTTTILITSETLKSQMLESSKSIKPSSPVEFSKFIGELKTLHPKN